MNPKHEPGLSHCAPEATDSKESEDTRSLKQREQQQQYAASVGMSDRQREMYEIFCAARAQVRAAELEEDIKMRNLFIEMGKKAMEDASKQTVDDNKKF